MNLRSMLSNSRTLCGSPKPQKPNDKTLLLILSRQLQSYINRANLSGKPWAVDELTLTVTGNAEDYPLPVDSHFGKPILVRTVYTANPSTIERDVDFVDLGDFNFDWGLPRNWGGGYSWDGSPNTAARIAFFRKSGTDQVYARVIPIPQQSAQYQILYQVGVYGETVPLDETPLLPEHHALIETWTALAALPHCEWSDDKADNSNRRRELGVTLMDERARLERNFERYLSTTSASTRPSYRGMAFGID